ncbi:hypothetical protein ACFQ3Z_04050 [Streptomyces nogalater]
MAWQQHRTSERQHLAATARRAATAAAGLRTTDPGTALRLGVTAWRLSRTPETRSALIGALAQRDLPTFTLSNPAETQMLGPDGRTLFGLGDGRFVRRDLVTHRVIDSRRLPADMDDLVMGDVSPDGRYVSMPSGGSTCASGCGTPAPAGTTDRSWGLPATGPARPGSRCRTSPGAAKGAGARGHRRGRRSVFGFSSSGHAYLFLTGSRLEVWDTGSGRRLFTHTAKALETSDGGDISPDNRLVAVCVQEASVSGTSRPGAVSTRAGAHGSPAGRKPVSGSRPTAVP